MKDKIVEDLKKEFDTRSCIGIDKYNTTLEANDTDDFLQHTKEELMDACLYIQKLQTQSNKDIEIKVLEKIRDYINKEIDYTIEH